jgi:hypothetical protein
LFVDAEGIVRAADEPTVGARTDLPRIAIAVFADRQAPGAISGRELLAEASAVIRALGCRGLFDPEHREEAARYAARAPDRLAAGDAAGHALGQTVKPVVHGD